MGSQLATILIKATATASPAGDVIWRNAEIENLEFIGVTPSKNVLEELVSFRGPSVAGETLARLVPGTENVAALTTCEHASVRTGVCSNRQATREQLELLANDASSEVRSAAMNELADRDRLRSAVTGSADAVESYRAASEILSKGRVEEIRWLHSVKPALLAGALASDDLNAARLANLEPETFSELAASIVSDEQLLVGASIARWVLGEGDLQEVLLADMVKNQNAARKRLTGSAQHLLTQAGALRKAGTPEPRKIHVRLEDMALALEPGEIAAMYFSTVEKTSTAFAAEVLDAAPVNLLVNHLIGQTARRPMTGEVVRLLRSSSPERRNEISDALENVVSRAEQAVDLRSPIEGLPWGGELALALKRVRASALREEEASGLLAEIDAVLSGDELAWEYLIALSEEWEGALIELVTSAARMEGIAVPAEA